MYDAAIPVATISWRSRYGDEVLYPIRALPRKASDGLTRSDVVDMPGRQYHRKRSPWVAAR